MSDRLFIRMHRAERNIAVIFMGDMSGWINDAERESLVLRCEVLETPGDKYAIYGFSGTTRKRCEPYRIKQSDEPCKELVKARISGTRPQDYTRMAAITSRICTGRQTVWLSTRLANCRSRCQTSTASSPFNHKPATMCVDRVCLPPQYPILSSILE